MRSVVSNQVFLDKQFSHPAGVVGSLAGVAMAMEHKKLHKEVVHRLSLGPSDRVLEIGFGPGTAIKLASAQASFVAGIDPSKEMVAQATRRNRAAIRSGRVEVLRASAEAIPFPNDSFSVTFEVNSFSHWAGPEVGLKQIFRVLRPGGRLLMVLRNGHSGMGAEVQRLAEGLAETGFKAIRFEEHRLGHGGVFVSARK